MGWIVVARRHGSGQGNNTFNDQHIKKAPPGWQSSEAFFGVPMIKNGWAPVPRLWFSPSKDNPFFTQRSQKLRDFMVYLMEAANVATFDGLDRGMLRINQREVAAMFKVCQTTVRKWLKRLQSFGLIVLSDMVRRSKAVKTVLHIVAYPVRRAKGAQTDARSLYRYRREEESITPTQGETVETAKPTTHIGGVKISTIPEIRKESQAKALAKRCMRALEQGPYDLKPDDLPRILSPQLYSATVTAFGSADKLVSLVCTKPPRGITNAKAWLIHTFTERFYKATQVGVL